MLEGLQAVLAWYRKNGENFYWAAVSAPSAKSGQWIQGAIKNPGALRAKAAAADALTKRGTIDVGWLRKMAAQRNNMETARQARLALTLRSMRR